MKSKQRMKNRKDCSAFIVAHFPNVLKCSSGNAEGFAHKMLKFMVCSYCWEHHIDFSTEVTFRNGGRADVVIKDWKLVIEILQSETAADFAKKEYPIGVLPITTQTTPEQLLAILQDLDTMDGSNYEYYRLATIDQLGRGK